MEGLYEDGHPVLGALPVNQHGGPIESLAPAGRSSRAAAAAVQKLWLYCSCLSVNGNGESVIIFISIIMVLFNG